MPSVPGHSHCVTKIHSVWNDHNNKRRGANPTLRPSPRSCSIDNRSDPYSCDPAADIIRSHAVLISLRLQVVPPDRLDTQHGNSQRTGPRFFTFGSRSSAARIEFSSLSPCFSCRANVVIGDIFSPGAQDIVDTINKLPPGNGKACWRRCDVTSWEDQIALYELAMTRFGGVDIVVSALFLDVHRWARWLYVFTRR